jgi:hypothetical protein
VLRYFGRPELIRVLAACVVTLSLVARFVAVIVSEAIRCVYWYDTFGRSLRFARNDSGGRLPNSQDHDRSAAGSLIVPVFHNHRPSLITVASVPQYRRRLDCMG